MSSLAGQKIVLGVTGGIAAYKSADLVRRLRERGAEVQVVMTAAAQQFVTPMTFQAVSGREVRSELWDPAGEAAMGHIELARWPDIVLIAPATAEVLAGIAHGHADDLLATLCLATDRPLHVAPAMNRLMWSNAATQANVATLLARGVHVHGPAEGGQACGETGPGRMLEPVDLVSTRQEPSYSDRCSNASLGSTGSVVLQRVSRLGRDQTMACRSTPERGSVDNGAPNGPVDEMSSSALPRAG